MGKTISSTVLSDTLSLSERTDGFWLWDKTCEMNLAMRAESSTAALVEALRYYQSRLAEVEEAHSDMSAKVEAFVAQFADEDTEDEDTE